MPQNESLSIKVTETGASHVADMFNKIAKEANKASLAVSAMRKEVGGKGTIKEVSKRGGRDKSVDAAKKATATKKGLLKEEVEAQKLASAKKIAAMRAENIEFKRGTALMKIEANSRIEALKKSQSEMDKAIKKSKADFENVTKSRRRLAEAAAKKEIIRVNKVAREIKAAEAKAAAAVVAAQKKIRVAREKTWKEGRSRHMARAKAGTRAKERIVKTNAASQARAVAVAARAEAKALNKVAREIKAAEAKAAAAVVAAQKKIRVAREKTWKEGRSRHMARAVPATRAKERIVKTNAASQARAVAVAARGEAKALNKATRAANKHAISMKKLENAVHKNTAGFRGLGSQVFFAQRAFTALGGALVVREYLQMSDTFQNMTNRIRLVTSSSGEFTDVQQKLFGIAKETRQSLSATVETYVRLRKATMSSGVSQERLMNVMRTLNQMLAVSGTTAIEAEQSIRQLSQAFSKGKLDGDEFRSVSEAMPAILTALEKSLGKTRGELRDMSESGQLTTEVLLSAFEAVKDSAMEDFGKSVVTIGQSWQVLKDEVLKATGEFNVSTGAIGILVKMVMLLAKHLGVVGLALQAVAGFTFVKLVQGAGKLLDLLMKSKRIPLVSDYVASLKAASTSLVFSEIALPNDKGVSKRLASAPGRLRKIGLQFSYLTAQFGVLNTALLGVGAAIAGWKLGSALDGWLGLSSEISDVLAHTNEARDNNSSMKGALRKNIAINQLERGQALKNAKNIYVFNRKTEESRAARLQYETDLAQRQLDSILKEEKITAEKIKQDKLNKAAEKYLDEAILKASPMLAIRKQITEEFVKTHQAMQNLNISYAEQMRWDLLFFASASKKENLLAEEVKQRNAILDAVEGLSKKEATIVRARSKNKARVKNQFGSEYFVLGSLTKVRPKAQKTEDALNAVSERERAASRRGSRTGRGATKSVDDWAKSYKALLESLNPVLAAKNKLIDVEKLLAKVSAKDKTLDTVDVLDRYKQSIDATLHPLETMGRLTEQNTKFLSVSTADQEAQIQFTTRALALAKSLGRQKASDLSAAQAEALQRSIESENDLNYENAHKAAIVGISASLDKKFNLLKDIAQMSEAINGSTLKGYELERARMDNLLRQVPAATDVINRYREGTLALTDAEYENWKAGEAFKAQSSDIQSAVNAGIITIGDKAAIMGILAKKTRAAADAAAAANSPWAQLKATLTDTAINQDLGNLILGTYQNMEQIAVDSIVGIEGALFELALNSESTWSDFTDNLQNSFRDMADAIIQDITRILVKMAIMAAMEAISPGSTSAVSAVSSIVGRRHGGTVTPERLPRYANGGGFQVGGRGGPDTKLVQFMASPGENVHVTNPGQSRLDNRQAPVVQAPSVNITNVVDPSQMAGVISSPAGRRAIMNVIQQEGVMIKRMLT